MLHVDDDAFVRAPADLVYRRLTHLAAYPEWWPGCRMEPIPSTDGRERYAWELAIGRVPAPWGRTLRTVVQPHAWRHDAGFGVTLEGALDGRIEWWLEEGWGGTVVHHLMAAEGSGRPAAVLAGYRRALRRGLWGFKDDLQAQQRRALGLAP